MAVLGHGRLVHAAVSRSCFNSDVFVVSALITIYSKCGDLAKARRIFDLFDLKDVVMWNSMITGYAQHGLGEHALSVIHNMRPVGMVKLLLLGFCRLAAIQGWSKKEGRFSTQWDQIGRSNQ